MRGGVQGRLVGARVRASGDPTIRLMQRLSRWTALVLLANAIVCLPVKELPHDLPLLQVPGASEWCRRVRQELVDSGAVPAAPTAPSPSTTA